MESIADYFSKAKEVDELKSKVLEYDSLKNQVNDLDSNNSKLILRNAALTLRCEKLHNEVAWITRNRDNLKAKHEMKVKTIVGLFIDGVLNLTEQEIADRLFVDVAYVNNIKATIRRERK